MNLSYHDIIDDLKHLDRIDRKRSELTATINGTEVRICYQPYGHTFISYEPHSHYYPQFEGTLPTVKRRVKEYYDICNTQRIKWEAV